MAQNPSQLVVAGTGSLWAAPYGTTLPTTGISQALATAFEELGYVTEDGLTFASNPTVEDFMAWQTRSPVRRELVGQELTVTFALEQWNERNLTLAFGGGRVTDLAGDAFRFDFLADTDALEESSLVCNWNDGDKRYRLVVPRGNVTDSTEVQLTRSQLGVLPVSFKALSPGDGQSIAYILTDDDNFAPAS